MAVLEEQYLVCTDFDRNNNKFVHFTLSDDGTVTSRWGRVGVTEQSKSWQFGSDAKRQFDRKVADKMKVKTGRDAYTKVDILTSTTVSQPTSNLQAVATRDIETDSQTTRDLIDLFTKTNVHNIVSSTTMTYNADEGVFRTPLGVVGKSMVDRARLLLDEIAPYVELKRYGEDSLKKLASEYLRLIPQDLGAANKKIRIDTIFTDANMKKQSDILDALEASITSVLTIPQTSSKVPIEQKKVFNVKLTECGDDDQKKAVEKLFNHTRKKEHYGAAGYEFKNLYTIDMPSVREAWEKDGSKLDNRMRLWHGTSVANLLSILKVGLIIPKKFTNGWAYGPGVYFSDQSTKSLQYASGFHTGKSEGTRIFMLLSDVGMGRYYVPTRSIPNGVPAGYDSCFAEAGKSGVANHEMIVYRTSQYNLLYLVEFSR